MRSRSKVLKSVYGGFVEPVMEYVFISSSAPTDINRENWIKR